MLDLLPHFLRTRSRRTRSEGIARDRSRFRPLLLECLEDRIVPSTVVYGPGGDSNLQTAINDAGAGGTVIVEPGAAGNVSATVNYSLTIQGASNSNPSQLPLISLNLNASGVNLRFLNLDRVNIAADTGGDLVSNSLVNTIEEQAAVTGANGNNTFQFNTITNAMILRGNYLLGGPGTNDTVQFNNFTSSASVVLQMVDDQDLRIDQNTFTPTTGNVGTAIQEIDTANVTISNNTISPYVPNSPTHNAYSYTFGISISNPSGVLVGALIESNFINTKGGTGVYLASDFTDDLMNVTVRQNDFNGNATGISYNDIGGAPAGFASTFGGTGGNGGNNFRTFKPGMLAIAVYGPGTATYGPNGIVIDATNNIFAGNVNPNQVVSPFVNATSESLGAAYIDNLNRALGSNLPSGTFTNPTNLNQFVNLALHAGGYNTIVNNLYIELLGRQADPNGLSYWVSMLSSPVNPTSLQDVEAGILASSEYTSRHGGSGFDLINNYYETLLGRSASTVELFTGLFVELFFGDQSVASMILNSSEYESKVVTQDFQTFLHRDPTQEELSIFAAPRTDLLSTEVTILSSNEFYYNG